MEKAGKLPVPPGTSAQEVTRGMAHWNGFQMPAEGEVQPYLSFALLRVTSIGFFCRNLATCSGSRAKSNSLAPTFQLIFQHRGPTPVPALPEEEARLYGTQDESADPDGPSWPQNRRTPRPREGQFKQWFLSIETSSDCTSGG